MKKLLGCLFVMALLPAIYLVGCSANTTALSPSAGSTATPTVTATPGGPTPTITATPQAQAVQAMVNLGTAGNYAALAYSSITNSGASTLCGSLGLFPGSSVGGGIVVTCGGVRDIADTAAN